MPVQPAGPVRDREDGRLRPRLRGRALLGVADDLRRHGPVDRRHQPAGPGRRSGQGADRLDAGRLRRDLHVRHDGLGGRDRRPRPQAARHQSRGRVQGLRGEARRREGARRSRLGLAALGSAGVPHRAGREGRWPQRPRGRGAGASDAVGREGRWPASRRRQGGGVQRTSVRPAHPPQRDDRGGGRGHRSARERRRGGRGRPRRARERARGAARPRSRIRSCWPCRSRASTSS